MPQKKTFEAALKELEKIVIQLETGEPTLEQALKQFEKGTELSQFCAAKLDETEKKITVLMENQAGVFTETPFVPDENGS
jgi:exodeoxyribonuclease VII small subunit